MDYLGEIGQSQNRKLQQEEFAFAPPIRSCCSCPSTQQFLNLDRHIIGDYWNEVYATAQEVVKATEAAIAAQKYESSSQSNGIQWMSYGQLQQLVFMMWSSGRDRSGTFPYLSNLHRVS